MSVAATLEPTGRAERVAPVRVGGRCPGRWAGWRQHEAWLDLLSRDQPCPPRTGSRLTGPPGPPCSIQRGSPPLCTPADGSLIPLPDRELAADARSASSLPCRLPRSAMAWPSATRGGWRRICWTSSSRVLDPDAAAGGGVRDDVGAADVIAVLVGASRGRSSHRPGAWTTGLTLLSCSTACA